MKVIQKNKKLSVLLISAFIIGLILSIVFLFGVAETWNLKMSDTLFIDKQVSKNIKIIAIDDKSLQEIGRWPWSRDNFAKVLNKIDADVIGVDVGFFETGRRDLVLKGTLNDNVILAVEYVYPGDEILEPVFGHNNLGAVNVFIDEDGIVREVPVRLDKHSGFAYQVARYYLGRDFSYGSDRLRINYVGEPGKFERVSFVDALEKGVSADIVLIGATSFDLHDNYLVPTSSGVSMPGVEVHANAVQTFLTRNYLSVQDKFVTVLLIFLFCFFSVLIMYLLAVWWSSLVVLGLIILYYAYSFFMFDNGIIVNMIYPVLGMILIYADGVVFYYLLEERSRKKVENVFGKYVSKNVMDHVMKMPDLHGIDKEVSVLFADVRGFTKMSEKMRPREVVDMLNKYLGGMADIVLKHDGTLDKYMGDCIMAFWNAPVNQKDYLLKAIKCGLEMQKVVDKIKKVYHQKVGVGVGINSGEAIVGNMGSKDRLEYTVIGDTVNLASRLCGLAGSGKVLISKDVYLKIKNKVKAKKLGEFKVKGKVKKIVVYDVVSVKQN